ncbi:hypothetical protein MPER_13848, partial [Moniliophthora perniciosa FA553]
MTELKSYLQSFLGVQFNAILDQATSPEHESLYGNWIGPPSTAFGSSNQTSACQGLIAAISLPQATIESPDPLPEDSGSKATPVGAIAGGVVGGIAVVVIAGPIHITRYSLIPTTVKPTTWPDNESAWKERE